MTELLLIDPLFSMGHTFSWVFTYYLLLFLIFVLTLLGSLNLPFKECLKIWTDFWKSRTWTLDFTLQPSPSPASSVPESQLWPVQADGIRRLLPLTFTRTSLLLKVKKTQHWSLFKMNCWGTPASVLLRIYFLYIFYGLKSLQVVVENTGDWKLEGRPNVGTPGMKIE